MYVVNKNCNTIKTLKATNIKRPINICKRENYYCNNIYSRTTYKILSKALFELYLFIIFKLCVLNLLLKKKLNVQLSIKRTRKKRENF